MAEALPDVLGRGGGQRGAVLTAVGPPVCPGVVKRAVVGAAMQTGLAVPIPVTIALPRPAQVACNSNIYYYIGISLVLVIIAGFFN